MWLEIFQFVLIIPIALVVIGWALMKVLNIK